MENEQESAAGKPEPGESEREFLAAIEDYKRRSGRHWPTWTEVLAEVRRIGYVKPL